MSRKIFISFLGTNNYQPCKYYIDGDKSTVSPELRFVQEATLLTYPIGFKANSKVVFLLTEKAKKQNWKDYEFPIRGTDKKSLEIGLERRLKEFNNFPFDINSLDISNGENEDEIWDIFQKVYDVLEESDEVHFDITHGFRSSPMLVLALINYAKFLKRITVGGIYYGAFEAKDKDGFTPIWNLTAFSQLQDWATAASAFTELGNSNALLKLGKTKVDPLLKGGFEKTDAARKINMFLNAVKLTTSSFSTNRGISILKGKPFQKIKKTIENVKEENFIVPMEPILSKIEEKISSFSTDEDWKNGFKTVEWCINNNLIQQGITMLQESIVTYYCIQNDIPYNEYSKREIINNCIRIKINQNENSPNSWKEELQDDIDSTNIIINSIHDNITPIFDALSDYRNDINHSGFRKHPRKPKDFENKLKELYSETKEILF